ncbi:MAG: DUF2946 family protein [Sphingomonas sp.]
MRSLLHTSRYRGLAVVLLVCALAMRMLVPSGFMPIFSGGAITIELCSGYEPQPMAMAMAMPGMTHHDGKKDQPGKAEMPCAFSLLAASSLAAADPIQLAIFVVFVMALGSIAAQPIAIDVPSRLRPPLRAPPHIA